MCCERGTKALKGFACFGSGSLVPGTDLRERRYANQSMQRPVTLTPLTSLASLCAPVSTTPPLAHRSTSTRRRTIGIDSHHTQVSRAPESFMFARPPNPHPPTPTSHRVCAVPSLAVAVARCSPKNPCFSARPVHRSFLRHCARACALFFSRRARRRRGGDDIRRRRRVSAAAAAAAQHVEPTATAPEIDRIMYCYAPMSNVPGP